MDPDVICLAAICLIALCGVVFAGLLCLHADARIVIERLDAIHRAQLAMRSEEAVCK